MADKNSDNLDNLLNSIRNEEEGVPEGLDDLLNDIRSGKVVEDIQENLDEKLTETSDSIMNEIDKLIAEYQNKVKSVRTSATQVKKKIEKKSAALAVIPKRVEKAEEELVDEDIDPKILELLGIDDPTGLDYSDYKSLLKEKMVANQMGSGLGLDQSKLRDEFKRVKGKTGKFTVRNQKIKAETFVSNKKKPSSSSRVVTPVPLLPGEIDEDIKPERQSLDKTVALIASKLNSVDSNVQQTVDNIQKKDAVEAKQDEQDRIDAERTANNERETRTERRNLLVGAVGGIKKAVKPVGDMLSGFFDFLKRLGFATLIVELLKFLQDPGEYIKGLKEWANGLIQTIEDGIKNTVKNSIIKPLNQQIEKFNEGIKDLIDKINPVLEKLSFIPGIRKIEEYQTPQVPTVPEDAVDGLELPKFNVESKPKETVMGEPAPEKSTETMVNQPVSSEGARGLLDFISTGEGGYNSMNQGTIGDRIVGSTHDAGSKLGKDLTEMTIGEVMDRQAFLMNPSNPQVSDYGIFAAGRYQIIPSTLKEILPQSGLKRSDMFSEENQDILGMTLITKKQPRVAEYLKGGGSIEGAMDALSNEFASMPDPKTGMSKYGDGNRALHTREEVIEALKKARSTYQNQSSIPKVNLNSPKPANVSMNTNSTNISPPVASASLTSIGAPGGGETPSANTTSSSDSQSRVIAFSASDPTNLSILATKSVYRVV
jgi:LmbE family N-acetylglucosaminyl deacetylase